MLADATSGMQPPLRASRATSARKGWRVIPAVDEDSRVVALVQTLSGRIGLFVLVSAFAAGLGLFDVDIRVAPLATAIAYAGSLRRYLIPLATLLMLYVNGFWVDLAQVSAVVGQEGLASQLDAVWLVRGSVVAVFALSAGLIAIWPRLSSAPAFQRPTLCLISTFVALVVVAQLPIAAGLPRAFLWAFLLAFQPYFWFLAYALSEQSAPQRKPVWQQLGMFHPFWGSTATPFGKGLAYLDRYDAKTPDQLAVTQLKGVKLICWLFLLAALLNVFDHVVYGVLGLPRFNQIFLGYTNGVHAPRYLCWISLATSFADDVLAITVWGGAIVACARMAGFRLLRNTYRPLEARTLAEFWNRYYFFYKELLVDHFFYPTFVRYFRTHRRLRIFFATFMAGCVGNLLFHFIRDIHFVAELGWRQALYGEASHAFYTFLLALGVGLSQMRARPRDPNAGWLCGRVLPVLWVILFFCILHVFDAPTDRLHSIGQRTQFLTYLLGIDTWI